MLTRYLRVRETHAERDSPMLWLGHQGAMTSWGIAQVIERCSNQAGLAGVHLHSFRHTAAHRFLAAGGQEGSLERLMGWRSPQMSRRYGASAADERARDEYRRLSPGDNI